jgi:hypothetical protein
MTNTTGHTFTPNAEQTRVAWLNSMTGRIFDASGDLPTVEWVELLHKILSEGPQLGSAETWQRKLRWIEHQTNLGVPVRLVVLKGLTQLGQAVVFPNV